MVWAKIYFRTEHSTRRSLGRVHITAGRGGLQKPTDGRQTRQGALYNYYYYYYYVHTPTPKKTTFLSRDCRSKVE